MSVRQKETEKQKELMLQFMQQHPDLGRGYLRYNRKNKRKIVSIMNINYILHKYI